jgi:nucleotide-binding universal stress UspA family protein
MKKILVPCDFSTQSKAAYKFGVEMATVAKGSVTVLNAIDLPLLGDTEFTAQPYVADHMLLKDLEANARENYEKLIAWQPFSHVKFKIVHGSVLASVRKCIEEDAIDLVIMGTLGSSGLEEYLVGSNTEKVVRYSNVPVLSVRKMETIDKIKNIVFATSISFNETELVNRVKELRKFFDAKLHVLYVNTPVDFKRDQDSKGLLEDYAKHFKLENYTLNIRNDPYEQDGIIYFAKEIGADMVAMATHGRRGLAHLFTGSIAEVVVNHIDCALWTYSLRKK